MTKTTTTTRAAATALAALLAAGLLAGCAGPGEAESARTTSTPTPTPTCATVAPAAFEALQSQYGARLGVFAVDVSTGCGVAFHADERFAYASTYKALAAGLLLGDPTADLTKSVPVTADMIEEYAPELEKHVGGSVTVGQAAEAAVRLSDNTAGNILFDAVGGPAGFEAGLRKLGDRTTEAARVEPDLNEATPGDERDTSTPRALATDLRALALSDALPEDARATLLDWMSGNATGDALVRAGAPTGWTVRDKSGAGQYATRNDIAVVSDPSGKPRIVLAVLTAKATADAERSDALVAAAARLTLGALAP